MVAAASRSSSRIVCSTESRYNAISGEMGRSTKEVVGSVIGSVVGSVVGLKQLCVFGCSLRWEYERCIALISDFMLVESSALSVSSSSFFITIGSSEICQ